MPFSPQQDPPTRTKKISSLPNAQAIRKRTNSFDAPPPAKTLVDGVFGGNGALIVAYVGALRALAEQRIWFARVAGSSMGALVASLIAVGYNASEIDWILGGFRIPPPPLPGGFPSSLRMMGARPISFSRLVDIPKSAADISRETKQQDILWRTLHRRDNSEPVKALPLREEVIGKIVTSVKRYTDLSGPAEQTFRGSLQGILGALPGDAKDAAPRSNAEIAAEKWSGAVDESVAYRVLMALMYDGGMTDSTAIIEILRRFLGAKIHNDPKKPVYFSELPIELAVIAANTDTKRVEVYSKHTRRNDDMEVAEAVRRSMSIPFLFQPTIVDGVELMDGMLSSSDPYWLFTSAGKHYITSSEGDAERLKLGFQLDDTGNTPAFWRSEPTKYVEGGKPYRPTALAALAQTKGLDMRKDKEGGMVERLFTMLSTQERKDAILQSKYSQALMEGLPYREIKIPLLGYHWLDFSLNSDEDDYLSLADRGWQATFRELKEAKLVEATAPADSPFQPD